ncbi:MAG: nucleotidyl transferase AbiEii/AbiGii toxin family protein [Planctomycetia bacterium]|nr:nucleotidyl transferase AbiEii/AbiGii toxin family protein [Planctomycetia bacterium]
MVENLARLDRIKRLAIVAVVSDDELLDRLVLKGGNLLDVVMRLSTRASVDLDFSMEGAFEDVEWFRRTLTRVLEETFLREGLVVFDVNLREAPPKMTDDVKDFWGGYQIDFKLIDRGLYVRHAGDIANVRKHALAVGEDGSTRFQIDVSKHEYCAGKRPAQVDNYTVYVYAPEMVVCEKLRAICQQMPEYLKVIHRSRANARARDLLDIHTVIERLGVDVTEPGFAGVLRQTFAAKRVPLRLLDQVELFREHHRPDFAAVQATVKAGVVLQDYDFYFDYLVDLCRRLKALGHI